MFKYISVYMCVLVLRMVCNFKDRTENLTENRSQTEPLLNIFVYQTGLKI